MSGTHCRWETAESPDKWTRLTIRSVNVVKLGPLGALSTIVFLAGVSTIHSALIIVPRFFVHETVP
jgi:hypothetical protein